MAGIAAPPLLSVSDLAKSYGGVPALRGASFALGAGEVVALMGENGAGKSTMIRILAGVTAHDSGTIMVDGGPATIRNPRDAHRLGLRFIHQELNVVPQLSVAENVFLGRAYPLRLGGFVDWRELNARARRALDALGVGHVASETIMARLPIGDRMLVKIAAAFLDDLPARVFVMDEPTATLNGEESERLFAIIARLQQRGCGILYVSHRIDEVLRLSTRITILRDGETRATFAVSEASRDAIIEGMTGRARVARPTSRAKPANERIALRVDSLCADNLADISFEVRAGEILGVAGLANAGQERLLKALMGGARRGKVDIGGKRARLRNPAAAWRQGLAYAPRERRSEGLFLLQDVTRNVVLPHLGWLRRFGAFINRPAEQAIVNDGALRVRLKAASFRQRIWRLSGGNQQKVMFARAIAGSPKVLLLDEPTRGVDLGAKADIHALLRELAAGGAAIILSTSDHEELLALAERVAILREGRLATIVPADGLSQQRLLSLCYGAAP